MITTANAFVTKSMNDDTTGNFKEFSGTIPSSVVHQRFNWEEWYWVVILFR